LRLPVEKERNIFVCRDLNSSYPPLLLAQGHAHHAGPTSQGLDGQFGHIHQQGLTGF
jgi:hypothetical protein